MEIITRPDTSTATTPLEFYLVTTDHLTESIWFRDDQDFKAGMNYIAIISLTSGILVLAFILMSNHIHLVLQCSRSEARYFIEEFKRRYSEYYGKRYGSANLLRRNNIHISQVYIENESLPKAIAYTIMNSVAANICLNASDYPWGSARAYFQITAPKGTRIRDMSIRACRKILHSREILPDNIIIGEDGYILPESFIPVKFVESIFRSPKRLIFFMMNSSKARHRLESVNNNLPCFKDQVILAAIPDICRSLFRKESIQELSAEEVSELISQVRRRFSADLNQIARVVGVRYSDVVRMLESF